MYYWINKEGVEIPLSKLPSSAYALAGFQNESDKGKVSIMVNDNGTCLVPLFNAKTRKRVIVTNPKLFGKDITENDLK